MGQVRVVHILQDKLGGIVTMNSHIIKNLDKGSFETHALLLRKAENVDTVSGHLFDAASQRYFHYSAIENLYSVIRRLKKQVPSGPGLLITNDYLELAMVDVYDVQKTVVHIVHDEYNLKLALLHNSVIDVFIAHSKHYHERLLVEMPSRKESIYYLPYGINLAPKVRSAKPGCLRLLFLGRLSEAKGIFLLPEIDKLLKLAGAEVEWTIMGNGPQKLELQTRWGEQGNVKYVSPATNEEVLDLCAKNDVLVFPTTFEGFPVALLEAMSAGLVPVVSDLPSGIPEVVSSDTGFRPSIGDSKGFAEAILKLERDRSLLEKMSLACRKAVESQFDIRDRIKAYERLFSDFDKLRRPRPKDVTLHYGSRLDNPWIPNAVVYPIRYGIRLMKGKRVR